MNEIKTRLAEGGRIAIPVEYRQALGLQVGDELIMGEIRIFTLHRAVKHTQELVRQYIPQGRLLSDELLAERRLES